MLSATLSLVPIFLLIVVGWALYRIGFPGQGFWVPIDRLTYYILFPCLIVRELNGADLRGAAAPLLAGTLLSGIAIMTIALLLLRPVLAKSGPSFTSVYQGAMRFNSFVGLGVVAGIHGSPGVALFAVAMAACVPVLNVLCVFMLARFAAASRPDWGAQFRLLSRNPLIIACIVGIALNLLQPPLPPGLLPTMEILGRAALPLGLMAVGAGLDLKAVRHAGVPLVLSCTARLLVFPLLVAVLGRLVGLHGLPLAVAVFWAALPTASSAYILARQMGGDAPLMAAIVTAQTLAAFVTLPLVITLLV